MPGKFLLTAAPQGASWEQILRHQPPVLDANGLVTGAWGECVHFAVQFEMTNPWQQMPGYEDGPVGQVIDFAGECGHGGVQRALEMNEERTKQSMQHGNQNYVFQLMPGQPGPPGMQPQMYGVPAQMAMGMQPQMYGAPAQMAMGMQPQMYGAPMGGAPPHMMMQPLVQVDAFKILESLPKVKIEEKMNMLETASGLLGELLGVDAELEMSNKYVIRSPQGHPLFFAIEQTDFLNRQCGGDCRAIDIDVVVLGQNPNLLNQAEGGYDWNFNPFSKVDLTNSQRFLRLHKDCQCTCCCFNRPIIQVLDGTTGQLIGNIRHPWACCDMTFELMDASDQPVLTSRGGCCQLGLICPCPCGPCAEVNFEVKDAKSGNEVGRLTKVIPDCLKFVVADDVDNYEVEFGHISNPQWRAMMVALGLFIDFRYFNTRSDKNDAVGDSGPSFFDQL